MTSTNVRALHEPWEDQYFGGQNTKIELGHVADQLYFAYGSNLHVPQMRFRCPDSKPAMPALIMGWQLTFRGVADIVPTGDPSHRVEGALWWISESDEAALDTYEGVRSDFYRRIHFKVLLPGELVPTDCLTYVMTSERIQPPSAGYFKTIADGFSHWSLDHSELLGALARSQQRPTDMRNHRRAAKWKRGRLSKPVSVKAGTKLVDRIRRRKILVYSP